MTVERELGVLIDVSGGIEVDLRYGRRVSTEHDRMAELLRAAIESAGGVRLAGLANRLSERLDQHYFDVRRHVAARGLSDEWAQESLRHLSAATFDIQVGRDLHVAQLHLEAHTSSCPLLDHRCWGASEWRSG